MNTSCQISPVQLRANPAAGNPLFSRWPFTRLQQLVATPRFVSTDLADNFSLPVPANTEVGPLPLPDRPDRARLMPVRLI